MKDSGTNLVFTNNYRNGNSAEAGEKEEGKKNLFTFILFYRSFVDKQ